MRRQKKTSEQGGPNVPAYIVTFSDMVTLLLTFFVMLLSLAEMQDDKLVDKGRASFVYAIRSLGIGLLGGKKITPDFEHEKIMYFIDEPDEQAEGRTIDAREEEIRRIFKKVVRSMKTVRSQIVAEKTDFSVTDIRFASGDSVLNEEAKAWLKKFSRDLRQNSDSHDIMLYVLGLAPDEPTERQQWTVSAQRAQAVAEFLRQLQRADYKQPVYCWGAGPGGQWVEQYGSVSAQSQILIAVLRANE